MSSLDILVSLTAMIDNMKESLKQLDLAIVQEEEFLNKTNDIQFDFTHTLEALMPTPEEAYKLVYEFHTMRNKRRDCKDSLRVLENNKDALNALRELISTLEINPALESRVYQIRTEEGESMVKSIQASSTRSKIPFILKDGKTYESPENEVSNYLDENDKSVSLVFSDDGTPKVELADRDETSTKEYKELANKLDTTLTSISEGKSVKESKSEILSINEKIKGIQENMFFLTKANNLWVIKKGSTIIIRSSKLSKVVNYASENKLDINIDTKYKTAVHKYIEDNRPRRVVSLTVPTPVSQAK